MKQDKLISGMLGDELALSPSDLLNQQFARTKIGGYNRQEVDDYIERVADVLENLINQVRQLKDKNDEQRRSIDEFRQLEDALRNALLTSQQHGEQMLDAARREANIIVEEAKLKRAQAQVDATKLPNTLARDIHLLEQQRSRLRVELIAILETHRRLIDSLVPEDSAPMPVGFFEAGATHGFTVEQSLVYADEPMNSVLEGISASMAAIEEPAAVDGDPDTEEADTATPSEPEIVANATNGEDE